MSLRVLCAYYQHCQGHVFPRFSFFAYHWFVLGTSMDDAWIVTMLPGSYIFPALSICNQLFPATCFPALFILCHHWLCFCYQHGSRMDSNHVTRLLHFFRSSHLLLATYFPVRIFDLFLLPAWIVFMLPATCFLAFFFCWVFCFFTFLPRVLIVLENFFSFRLFLTDQSLIQFLSSYRFYSSFQPPLNLFQCI